ncbi:AsnC family transcriptional regulator [Methanonatronarchaeum sp. AMET6-2]|uniref:siroheme decarboxylase subunit alpha n=1 Tax=Methanonatronarchaeum sp. AMET6-2 TaxID=2933293 RepID=UPI0012192AC0|nr:AsnC family transcriptional regulator [Methanonatronarchaeum sp. AMET6-2]RZN60633.1 MAG: Lrp/AsnC family transcriptional regulator [Methanonatronarchaeia archaeon]UOY09670.1 AsnC family transcriptional regulator [Methanonatronarchaeum sp. AMET6-2]
MDEIDKEILEALQSDFPVKEKPFEKLAAELDIQTDELLLRIEKLTEKGFIRRIAPIIDSREIGLTGTLVAMKVPEHKVEDVAETVSQYTEVSHNYERNHEYNLWFTLSATSRNRIKEIISEIESETGIEDIIELPSIQMFKIGVSFSFTE